MKTQATVFVYFIIDIIEPLQTHKIILHMRAANGDGSRRRCPRRREEKREEDSKPSLSSKKGFVGEKKWCVQEEAREKKKRNPSHRRRKKASSEKKIVCVQEEDSKPLLSSKKGFIGEKNSVLLFWNGIIGLVFFLKWNISLVFLLSLSLNKDTRHSFVRVDLFLKYLKLHLNIVTYRRKSPKGCAPTWKIWRQEKPKRAPVSIKPDTYESNSPGSPRRCAEVFKQLLSRPCRYQAFTRALGSVQRNESRIR